MDLVFRLRSCPKRQPCRKDPEEFHRKVLDLVAAGRPIAENAHDLQVSDQTIYGWHKQDLIDTGQVPGLSRLEQSELTSTKKRIRKPPNEVALPKRSLELLKAATQPTRRSAAVATMAAEGLPVQASRRLLKVLEAGYYNWHNRPPSLHPLRHT